MTEILSAWRGSDQQPISMDTFQEMIMPAWARLYIEVSSSKNTAPKTEGTNRRQRVDFYSDEVMTMFVTLTGFDPRRAQFSALDQQHKCLDAAREMEAALELADEVYQLDGLPALDFAAGWMACRDMLRAMVGKPDEAVLEPMLNRATTTNHWQHEQAFVDGFKARFKDACHA